MAIQYYCPSCSKPIEVDDSYGNHAATCPYCGAVTNVPAASTYRPDALGAPPPPPRTEAWSAGVGPGGASAGANAAGLRMGGWSLTISAIALVLFVAGFVGAMSVMAGSLAGTTQPSVQQMEELQLRLMREQPWVLVSNLMGILLAGVGLVLGIVALSMERRGNWMAVVGVVMSGLLFSCVCAAFAIVTVQSGSPA